MKSTVFDFFHTGFNHERNHCIASLCKGEHFKKVREEKRGRKKERMDERKERMKEKKQTLTSVVKSIPKTRLMCLKSGQQSAGTFSEHFRWAWNPQSGSN